MNGLDLLLVVVVVVGALYVARRLDEWEQERELDGRWEDTMRRAGEALDEAERPVVFDREGDVA